MDFLHAILLGAIEGFTEFLPISSTFHLIWTAKILGIPHTDGLKLFEVVVQSGTILAVLWLFRKTILTNRKLLTLIFLSFFPTAVIGFFLYAMIKQFFFENYVLQVGVFALFGFIFIAYELLYAKKSYNKQANDINGKEALLIGVAQSLAVIPGVSRAGIVLLTMMLFGVKRPEAAVYSFLLAIPTILMATLYDLYKMRDIVIASDTLHIALLIGFITAFMSAVIIIQWFIRFLSHRSLLFFGIYRIVLAFILLIFFLHI